MHVSELPKDRGFWYLATAYSKYPGGLQKAYEFACEAAAILMQYDVHVFCPISHSHGISIYGGINPVDHEIWLLADQPFMRASTGILVVIGDGWDESYGISEEIAHFRASGKPVLLFNPESHECQPLK
jgi:hypothetical protein